MSTNTSGQTFSATDLSREFQEMLQSIDTMNAEMSEKAIGIVQDSAQLIADEQRRLIAGKSSKLASLIKAGRTVVTRKGSVNVLVGYDSAAVREAPESVVIEFGRPGKRAQKKGGVMKQKRGKKGEAKEVEVKIGPFKFGSINHIRKGFDNAQEKALQVAVSGLEEVLDEWK